MFLSHYALHLPPTAVLGTAFAIFPIWRLSSVPYLWPHSQFFPFVDYLCSILVTAFAFFPIWRLSPAPYLWPHSQFFLLADYLLLYICDRIHNFSHLQIISCTRFVTAFPVIPHLQIISALYLWLHSHFFSFADYLPSKPMTAFAIFLICRLSLLYTCDCIRIFSHLQIIFPATPPLRLCWGCLQAGAIPWYGPGILTRLALRDAG